MLWHPSSERTPGWLYLSLAWPLMEFSMRETYFMGQDFHMSFFSSRHLVSAQAALRAGVKCRRARRPRG